MSIEHVGWNHLNTLVESGNIYAIPVESPLEEVFNPVAFLAGPGALISQVSNEKILEGVLKHSNFDKHPFDRLYNTLKTTQELMLSSDEKVWRDAARRIMGVHKKVKGQTADGKEYSATHSHLVCWVWATLAHGAIKLHERLGASLSEEDLDVIVRHSQIRMPLLRGNITTFPQTYKELEDYMQREVNDGNIVVNESTLKLKEKLFHPFRKLKPITRKFGKHLDLLAGATMHPALRKLWFPNWGEKEEKEVENLFNKLRSPIVVYQRVSGRK